MADIHIRLSEAKDADIIKFWKNQSNKSMAMKFIIRKLISQFGYDDILKHINVEDIQF